MSVGVSEVDAGSFLLVVHTVVVRFCTGSHRLHISHLLIPFSNRFHVMFSWLVCSDHLCIGKEPVTIFSHPSWLERLLLRS